MKKFAMFLAVAAVMGLSSIAMAQGTDHVAATEGIECRKDVDVIDETPMAYKDIDAVMHAQRDLVDIVHTLRQVVCVKG